MIKEDKQTEVNLELWKWFTDDAAKIKDTMWTIASFLNLIHNPKRKIFYE